MPETETACTTGIGTTSFYYPIYIESTITHQTLHVLWLLLLDIRLWNYHSSENWIEFESQCWISNTEHCIANRIFLSSARHIKLTGLGMSSRDLTVIFWLTNLCQQLKAEIRSSFTLSVPHWPPGSFLEIKGPERDFDCSPVAPR
jgi:hypothetical protein